MTTVPTIGTGPELDRAGHHRNTSNCLLRRAASESRGKPERGLTHHFDSDGTTTKTTIPNLASNTTYQVQVRANNDEGEGQWAMDSGTTGKTDLTVAFTSAAIHCGRG